ncbi:hypothetical protein K431DRAFT_100834 [Polychaeton citri CBS 116435]|uniref:Uncharacterized protein n=1 Tax=Polychaeton citri CBS 116435 TaxID=1314669 RepID=A0A9P4QF82_9PEZI|nr:hypothetical protein K431DRAFT_100834 [Polychaeton citri CBS 116435]
MIRNVCPLDSTLCVIWTDGSGWRRRKRANLTLGSTMGSRRDCLMTVTATTTATVVVMVVMMMMMMMMMGDDGDDHDGDDYHHRYAYDDSYYDDMARAGETGAAAAYSTKPTAVPLRLKPSRTAPSHKSRARWWMSGMESTEPCRRYRTSYAIAMSRSYCD